MVQENYTRMTKKGTEEIIIYANPVKFEDTTNTTVVHMQKLSGS